MSTQKTGIISKFLSIIEKLGNMLPHPASLFFIFAILTVILSGVFSALDYTAVHPGDGSIIKPFNLMSAEGLQRIMENMVTNFTSFAPLGTVLVSLLGIGIAEGSGLIAASIRLIVRNAVFMLITIFALGSIVGFTSVDGTMFKVSILVFGVAASILTYIINKKKPDFILTFIIVFSGILSNTASEVGYVLLVPIGAIMFMGAGRHPIAGLAAAFAGVSGGYSANLLLGTIDPLLAGLSQEAAQIIDPTYEVSAAANMYFMMASTFFIAIAGSFVTQKIVEPRLGKYEGGFDISEEDKEKTGAITKEEKKGLIYALITAIGFTVFLAYGAIPEDGYFRDLSVPADAFVLLKIKPFLKSIVGFIFLGAGLAGIAYGIGARTIKDDNDIMNGMGKAMETLGIYIVLVFFAAQFVAYFKETNLGLIFAVNGATMLKEMALPPAVLLVAFIIISAIINLVMGSASAKWGIMAPVFIPMFMLLGFSPELVQGAYRVGDSVTNIISPMMSYFALIVAFMARYKKDAGIGTIISTMLPYTFVFFLVWTVIFLVWFALDVPLGPGSPMFIDPAELGK